MKGKSYIRLLALNLALVVLCSIAIPTWAAEPEYQTANLATQTLDARAQIPQNLFQRLLDRGFAWSGDGWYYDGDSLYLLDGYDGIGFRVTGDLTVYSSGNVEVSGGLSVYGGKLTIHNDGDLSVMRWSNYGNTAIEADDQITIYNKRGTLTAVGEYNPVGTGGDGIRSKNSDVLITADWKDSAPGTYEGRAGTSNLIVTGGYGEAFGGNAIRGKKVVLDIDSTITGGKSSRYGGRAICVDSTASASFGDTHGANGTYSACDVTLQSGNSFVSVAAVGPLVTSGITWGSQSLEKTKSYFGNISPHMEYRVSDDVTAASLQLYAKTYTTTINGNGGTVNGQSNQTVSGKYPTKVNLGSYNYARAGYTLSGFTVNGESVSTNYSFIPTSNTTVAAQWQPGETTTYTITFDANGGTVNPTSAATGSDSRLISLPTPTRTGYMFDGWYTSASGGTEVTTATVFASNATIYAHWKETGSNPTPGNPSTDTYTITFNANGGSVSPTTRTTGTDGKLTSLPTPVRDGYIFDGWYISASGGTEVTTATVFASDTTVYAHWIEDWYDPTDYRIYLYSDPYRGGSVYGGGTYKEGEYVTVRAYPASGYRFLRWTENGWYVNSSADYSFTVTGSRTLTAEFELISGWVSPGSSYTSGSMTNTGSTVSSTPSPSNNPALRNPYIKNTVDTMPRMPSDIGISSTPSASSSPFSDVPSSSTFSTAVMWAQNSGIMGGYTDGTFRPYAGTNRQQMWMALARLSGANPASMAEARTWAINAGISDGSNAEEIMNRQQMATMVYRFAKSQGITTSGSTNLSAYFDSSNVAPYAREAMAWAVGNGLITGVTDGTLKADSTAVRAHFVTFLYRFNRL